MAARRGRPIGCRTSYEFADRGIGQVSPWRCVHQTGYCRLRLSALPIAYARATTRSREVIQHCTHSRCEGWCVHFAWSRHRMLVCVSCCSPIYPWYWRSRTHPRSRSLLATPKPDHCVTAGPEPTPFVASPKTCRVRTALSPRRTRTPSFRSACESLLASTARYWNSYPTDHVT
jgi:hypothetical protein